ncbi:hypothetical protein OG214_35350 [Streptomyces sp. NBC_00872]|nr:hypothetical protein OG214_35350 [Streptomyces sp. NBC_00872]
MKPLVPREVDGKLVPPAWRKAVYANPDPPQGVVDRDAYVVCVLERLYRALNNRDVFAAPSHRVGGRVRGSPGGPEPGHARRGAPGGAGARPGRGVASSTPSSTSATAPPA